MCERYRTLSIEIDRFRSVHNINAINFKYDRKKDSTSIMGHPEEWSVSVFDFEINKDLQIYNNTYRKKRYGLKPSLLYKQYKKNQFKTMIYKVRIAISALFLLTYCFVWEKIFKKSNNMIS